MVYVYFCTQKSNLNNIYYICIQPKTLLSAIKLYYAISFSLIIYSVVLFSKIYNITENFQHLYIIVLEKILYNNTNKIFLFIIHKYII